MKISFTSAIILLLLAYVAFDYFYNKYRIDKLHYGTKANELRKKLKLPIIDDYMHAESRYNEFFGNRWNSSHELPKNQEPLHIWKTVTPLTDTNGLYEEKDAYRKEISPKNYLQLNIYSKVHGDTTADRHGKQFTYPSHNSIILLLDDNQIDSVCESWGLRYLIRRT